MRTFGAGIAVALALLALGPRPGCASASAGAHDRAPALTAAPAAPAAYVCEHAGGRVYADRPCDERAASAPVPLAAPNGYAAPAIDRRPPVSPPPPKRPDRGSGRSPADPHARAEQATDAAAARVEARCRALGRRLDRVEARLRAGYSAAEGERLKEQRRELREDRRWYACARGGR